MDPTKCVVNKWVYMLLKLSLSLTLNYKKLNKFPKLPNMHMIFEVTQYCEKQQPLLKRCQKQEALGGTGAKDQHQ